jgi:hypothetical protein
VDGLVNPNTMIIYHLEKYVKEEEEEGEEKTKDSECSIDVEDEF